MKDIIKKLNSIKLCLSAHPDNEPNSEFEDRIDTLEEIIQSLPTYVSLPHLIDELRGSWKPKKETRTGYGYHGSSKGDEIEYTVFLNEYSYKWTTEDAAFKGYVHEYIDKFIK